MGGGGLGRGQGRGDPRRGRGRHTWERQEQAVEEPKKAPGEGSQVAEGKANDKWDKAAATAEGAREQGTNEDQGAMQEKKGNNSSEPAEASQKPAALNQNKTACDICGLFNHTTRDCRKMLCEIYGYNNHTAYDCMRCIPWNSGPELCAAQVED